MTIYLFGIREKTSFSVLIVILKGGSSKRQSFGYRIAFIGVGFKIPAASTYKAIIEIFQLDFIGEAVTLFLSYGSR